jgi:hypothetical protein
LVGRNHLEDLGIDERILIKWILMKWSGRAWTEFIWHRIGAYSMLL